MSKTANKKDVLKRLHRIKKNRFFTRMFLYLGVGASTLTSPGRPNAAANTYSSAVIAKHIEMNMPLSKVSRDIEISKRVDWFFDNAIDSLRHQYNEFTSLKTRQRNQMIEKRFFNEMSLQGGAGGRAYYCLAATMSNYARLSRQFADMQDVLPDLDDGISYTKASCEGFINYMKQKSKQEFDGKFFIKSRNLNKEISKVSKGAIFLVESADKTSSGYHAITYLGRDEYGEAQFMSYNRERISSLAHWGKGGAIKGYAVDLAGMTKASWEKKTQNCNKMEFLAMMYNQRQEKPMLDFAMLKPVQPSLPVSSLYVSKKELSRPLKVKEASAPVWSAVGQKQKKGAVFFINKNKIVLKRKFQLASRWSRDMASTCADREIERIEAFFDRPRKGTTFNAAPLFAEYKYKSI